MSALIDLMPQSPADYALADSCELTYEQVYDELRACERENLRLRMLVSSLQAQLAKTVPMPPEPSDIDW